ncbi:hypothetical protein ACNOYE_38900 [Nannocystaceae bacterium ST9]
MRRGLLLLSLGLIACKPDPAEDSPPKSLTLDIGAIDPSLEGKLVIDVPPGSKAEPLDPGRVSIRGPQAGLFSLIVDVQPNDLEQQRKGAAELVLDEPDLMITKIDFGESGSMLAFVANVRVGERTFGCEQDTAAFLDRAQIDAMIAACRTLRIE